MEPIVDTVEHQAQTTTPCRFFMVDLNTVKETDLCFKNEFTVECTRDDFTHALIAWFDVEFSKCHKLISLSTAPAASSTHWKQTVFYLEDVLVVSKGDKISGWLECKPNAKNPRDLDIQIHVNFDGKYNTIDKTQEYLLR